MTDRKEKPLASETLEAEAEREHEARVESDDGESDLREDEKRAVETSLTRLPPG
ncbi:hypothetical protein [Stakelama pacifica]|uniref:Uncharacterized protein n=1 Tax=Stakelama pacifica TaxID=517720 RepID=A0A4R6FUK1_9SPHN|nr:hypothetical protein [Stakelama pacifica]TDN84565.1 hypothetical protein EV664_103210 [Stakelama pacifica]GGO93441.1 hypothetical protein GCM10011329_12870 [Stakelama pacifica]